MTAKQKKAATRVYDYLRKGIEEGTLRAGQRLTEQAIAQNLGISRTPVRQAFNDLVEAGYLEKVAHVGVHVKRTRMTVRGFQERTAYLEKLISYYVFDLEKKELNFATAELEKIIQSLQEALAEKTSAFEGFSVQYFEALLAPMTNAYMKKALLRTVRELYLQDEDIQLILKGSRLAVLEELIRLTDHLANNNYPLARRALRILFNQMTLDVIEKTPASH